MPPLSTTDWATIIAGFGGAVLGAIAGALFSIVLASKTARQQKFDERRTALFRLQVKASIILSEIDAYHRWLGPQLARVVPGDTVLGLWQKVLPIVGTSQQFDVDPGEIAVLAEMKNNELMNLAVTLPMRHRELAAVVSKYSSLREEMHALMPADAMVGDVATSPLTTARRLELAPRFFDLDSLIRNMTEEIQNLRDMGNKLVNDLGPAAQKYLNDKTFPAFATTIVDGKTKEAPAQREAGPGPLS